MLTQKSVDAWNSFLAQAGVQTPYAHVVLGTGFGAALGTLGNHFPWKLKGETSFSQIPGLHHSTVQDHAGKYCLYFNEKLNRTVCFQAGRIHGYEGHAPRDVVSPVLLPRLGGVSNFLLTNAAGGVGKGFAAGDIMVISDHVNLTGSSPLVGKNPVDLAGKEMGPRFPDLANLYRKDWQESLFLKAKEQGLQAHKGIYLGVLGPNFETPAEIKLYQMWGMGAVGMSTVWEAIALSHAGASVAGLSLISNLGAGLVEQNLDHHTVVSASRVAAEKVVKAVFQWVEGI